MSSFDPEAYFARVGYAGPRSATADVLHALADAHVRSIPFENLDVLLGVPIRLDEEATFDKLVRRRRGGYCFEQNGLFLRVLEALGFKATPLGARVRIDRPRHEIPPRTHMFLLVEIEGESWIADVGIGGLSLTSAIRLELDREQPTPHETRRIIREDGRYFHQVRFGERRKQPHDNEGQDEWKDVCEFTLDPMPLIDRELANWYTSAHPQSHFKRRLMVARADRAGARLTLLDRELKLRRSDGQTDARQIDSADELLEILRARFGLEFPPSTRFGGSGSPWPT